MEEEKDLELGIESAPIPPVSRSLTSDGPAEVSPFNNSPEHDELEITSTQYSNQLSLSAVQPVDLKVRNLAVNVDISPSPLSLASLIPRKRKAHDGPEQDTKTILHDVSANMPRGTLTAIIGGSGSGKTTMLNTMAERLSSGRWTITGNTMFNGKQGIHSIRSAYVMQQDVLLPTLTVRETLQYSADLRLPPPTTEEERKKVVEEVILELGLKECADTRIGNNIHKGCSGGEKRRTSIGVQLLSNPSVLFLDEPTTGLDATSAFQLVKTLKSLAGKGRTIVTTIHQPRSEIWGLIDELVILTKGSPVYSGPADSCIPYFKRNGMELPAFVNPAEFLIDIAAIDNRTPQLEAASTERVERLKGHWLSESPSLFPRNEEKTNVTSQQYAPPSSHRSAFTCQVRVLTARTLKVTYRDPMGMTGSILEAIAMALMTGWIFLSLGSDQAGIRSRQGALYSAAALQGYLILMYETYRLSLDIALFDREHNEGVVGVAAFLLSRRLARFPVEDLPVPLFYSLIFYWMCGFRTDVAQFFIFFAIVILTHHIAVTFATCCVAAERSFAGASVIANLGYTVQSMACGYFIQSQTIPVYVRWLKWTAYVFYAFGALCANEFAGHFYDCPLEGGEANPACKQYTGAYIMDSLGFPEDWIARPIVVLLCFSIMFYVLAGVGFRFKKVGVSVAKARNSETDFSAGKEKMAVREAGEVRTVDIKLNSFALDLKKRTTWGEKMPTKPILHPVTANFQSGLLNFIMGPSGSGKTSLLNAMALRLHSSFGTRYLPSGEMTFNGTDDDALLPSLTVRETLRFAAGLRLPSHMSKEEKNIRAEEVLLKMGLKDCADNLIGSELVKGISGGEKRRVTIAVQILTDPRVLLLDEPTSGLDAFTATSIMEVLQGLANEGRTLILTIHQSRSDFFKRFGTVLLLARGGSPVYAGTGSNMIPHFSSLGYPCPITTNPADFALDLITIDLQHSAKEADSRAKVSSLISSWTPGGDFSPLVTTAAATTSPAQLGSPVHHHSHPPFTTTFPLLIHRSALNLTRQPALLATRTAQVLGLALILTLFFAPLHNDYYAVQNRLGFIQEFGAFYFVGVLQNVAVYPAEKAVFEHERLDGVVGVESFLAAYLLLEVPFEVITAGVFGVLVVWAAGLGAGSGVGMWAVAGVNCFCIVSCGESLGIMFNTLFEHTGFAINITSVLLSISLTMSGILSINMPTFLSALNYLSPIRYAIRNLAPYSLRDVAFTCDAQQRLPNGDCIISSGKDVLTLYGLDVDPRWELLALAGCAVLYRVAAYGLLKAKHTHWDGVLGREKEIAGP